jgi:hypothetical protein
VGAPGADFTDFLAEVLGSGRKLGFNLLDQLVFIH